MVDVDTYRAALEWLTQFQRPLLLTHRKPDGDALGAVAGFALTARALGLEPRAALFEPYPPRYPFLAPLLTWHMWESEQARLVAEADCAVVLDTCSWTQLESAAAFLRSAPPTLVIDHHATRDEIGARHGDHTLFDTSAAATCVMIAEWIAASGLALTAPVAGALFTGIATDTGWFRFSNTDARALRVATTLVEAGAEPNALYRPVYERDTAEKLRLIGRMLGSLELHADGQLAVMVLREQDFAETGALRTMTEDLVNEAGRLASNEGTLLFTEDEAGVVRINLRSKAFLDVSALAQQFGGGGHARAAGARVAGAVDDVRRMVVEAAERLLTSASSTGVSRDGA